MNRFCFILIVLFTFYSNSIFSQTSNNLETSVEKIVKKYMDSLSIVGISVSVIQKNQIRHKKSYGYANLELEVPMADSSVFRIWSISKQFCVASILKLEKAGLIKLNDPIGNYLDSIPQTWDPVTIQQLLSHTSGIKDYLNDFPEGKKLNGKQYEEVLDSTRVLKFTPGDKWSYSNTGYWVLTKIIEKVTGKPYQNYLNEAFFNPLGMTNTQKNDFSKIVKNRVNGYKNVKGVMKNSTREWDENYMAEGDGELMSTLDDLTIWTKALFSGKIIALDDFQKSWNFAKNNNAEKVNASWIIYYDETASYGMGWFISELEGHKIIWTPGAGKGFSTTVFSVPSFDLNIIVLCNARRFLISDKIAKEIAITIMNEK